jgi:hypothetical protein
LIEAQTHAQRHVRVITLIYAHWIEIIDEICSN